DLLTDAFTADAAQVRGMTPHGGDGGGIESEVESRGEAHGPQQAEIVLAETLLWVADGADDAGLKIAPAADVIDDAILGCDGERILEEAVDGEVTASRVILRIGEGDAGGSPAVGVAPF